MPELHNTLKKKSEDFLSSNIVIRSAKIDDIEAIFELLKYFSEQKLLLAKSIDDLYKQIRGFRVAILKDKVIGSAHLDVFTENLAEEG